MNKLILKKDKIEINPKKKLKYLICNPNIKIKLNLI